MRTEDQDNSRRQALAQYESIADMVDALEFAEKHEGEDIRKPAHDMREIEYHLAGFEEDTTESLTGHWSGTVDATGKREFIETDGTVHWFFEHEVVSDEQDTSDEFYQLEDEDRETFLRLLESGYDADDLTDPDACRQRIDEDPLSVEVRGDWHTPGDKDEDGPSEYRILLCTGGPAVQIVGDLDRYNQPSSARLMHQDWFKPWTEVIDGVAQSTLLKYASCFWFGE